MIAAEPYEYELPVKKFLSHATIKTAMGAVAMVLGAGLFFSAILWFASIDTASINRGTNIVFFFGILCGIFQLGSTQILCLLDLKTKWDIFIWFTLACFLASTIVLVSCITAHVNPDAPNVQVMRREEIAVMIFSGLDSLFTFVLLLIALVSRTYPKSSSLDTSSVPYDLMS